MAISTDYVALTDHFLSWTGMTHEMAHLHGGLFIYLAVQTILRTRRASAIALQAVIALELANEILQWGYYDSWRWSDTLNDIALTLFWPTALYFLGSYRRARWNHWVARQNRADGAAMAEHLMKEAAVAPAYSRKRR